MLKRSKNKQRGQALVEYLILIALMAVASLGMLRLLQHTVGAKFAEITFSLQGKKRSVVKESPEESDYSKKDMGTFLNGSASPDKAASTNKAK